MFRQIAKMPTDSHQGPSLDAMLEPMDAHLKNFDHLVEPAPDSKPRTPLRQWLAEKGAIDSEPETWAGAQTAARRGAAHAGDEKECQDVRWGIQAV